MMTGFWQSSGTSPVHHNISGMKASDLSDVCYCISHEQARYQLKKCATESGFVYSHNIYHQQYTLMIMAEGFGSDFPVHQLLL